MCTSCTHDSFRAHRFTLKTHSPTAWEPFKSRSACGNHRRRTDISSLQLTPLPLPNYNTARLPDAIRLYSTQRNTTQRTSLNETNLLHSTFVSISLFRLLALLPHAHAHMRTHTHANTQTLTRSRLILSFNPSYLPSPPLLLLYYLYYVYYFTLVQNYATSHPFDTAWCVITRIMAPNNKLDVTFLLNKPASSSGSASSTIDRSQCPICGHRFTQVGDMRKHMRTVHERLRPYKCEICGRSFGENGNLQKHRRSVHLKERPFSCPRCAASFAFKDGLTRHIKLVHENQHPFHCTLCGARYKQKSQLRKHAESCSRSSRS